MALRRSITIATADTVFLDTAVICGDAASSRARAVAVKDGRIAAVGSSEEVGSFAGPHTRVIRLPGSCLIPGFHDAHIHLLACASAVHHVDCGPGAVSSIAEMLDAIRDRAARIPPGEWLKAGAYDEFALVERRHPTRWDLDTAAPYHPVKLQHRSRHACVLNSRALQQAGIDRDFVAPAGARIEVDEASGEPTGLVYDLNEYLSERIPPASEAALESGFAAVIEGLMARGITAVQDATAHNGVDEWNRLARLLSSAPIHPAVTMMVGYEAFADGVMGRLSAEDTGLRLGPVKLKLTETTGAFHPSAEELFEQVWDVHSRGYSVAIHAIEESAVCMATEAIAAALERRPRRKHGHRLEHVAVGPPPLLERIAELGVGVATQPVFVYHSGDRYLADVPVELQDWLYPVGGLHRRGVVVAAGSDAPVAPYDPLASIYGAVTRRSRGGATVAVGEGVTVEQALRMHTLAPARLIGMDGEVGSIEVGKRANLVLLSADPTTVDPEALLDIQPVMTMINGRVAYERR